MRYSGPNTIKHCLSERKEEERKRGREGREEGRKEGREGGRKWNISVLDQSCKKKGSIFCHTQNHGWCPPGHNWGQVGHQAHCSFPGKVRSGLAEDRSATLRAGICHVHTEWCDLGNWACNRTPTIWVTADNMAPWKHKQPWWGQQNLRSNNSINLIRKRLWVSV